MAHGMPNVAHIPPEELQNFLEDPHMAQAIQNMDPAEIREAVAHVPRDVHNRNPLLVLLESILPWVDYGAAHDDNQDHGHDQGNEH